MFSDILCDMSMKLICNNDILCVCVCACSNETKILFQVWHSGSLDNYNIQNAEADSELQLWTLLHLVYHTWALIYRFVFEGDDLIL